MSIDLQETQKLVDCRLMIGPDQIIPYREVLSEFHVTHATAEQRAGLEEACQAISGLLASGTPITVLLKPRSPKADARWHKHQERATSTAEPAPDIQFAITMAFVKGEDHPRIYVRGQLAGDQTHEYLIALCAFNGPDGNPAYIKKIETKTKEEKSVAKGATLTR